MPTRSTGAPSEYLDQTAVLHHAAGRAMLAALAAADFAAVEGVLAPDVHLRALLPGGCREWDGAEAVAHRFARWFGDAQAYELVDGAAGPVGARQHMHWRIRVRAERLGERWCTVEQQCYADLDPAGRIVRLDLLCSGFLPDGDG